ncbi:MAG: hypothetical protein QM673_11230 [Gordonia sp. (in: high G+C Gram-positive bacteria)]
MGGYHPAEADFGTVTGDKLHEDGRRGESRRHYLVYARYLAYAGVTLALIVLLIVLLFTA